MNPSGMSAPEGSVARTIIERAMRHERLAHAILLSGRSQPALEALAFEMAALLLEWKVPVDGRSITTFADFFSLRPSKKARQISAIDTRELIRQIQHSPQIGKRKIAVIFEADRLNPSSSNIFLKTLEEPPLDTTILLLTTRPYSLLPTIRSRCLHLRVTDEIRVEDDTETTEWLKSYRGWLDRLEAGPPAREAVPELILGLYALVSGFKANLERATKIALAAQDRPKGEALNDEEEEAFEARVTISVRDHLMAGIEETTSRFARDQAARGDEAIAARLPAVIEALEDINRLLRVYFPVPNAIEQFLLISLRLWTAPKS